MDKFVIEKFVDGEMCAVETVELHHRLLNEVDLNIMVSFDDAPLVFVRYYMNTTHGYYKDSDGLWTFGDYESAINDIKRRL